MRLPDPRKVVVDGTQQVCRQAWLPASTLGGQGGSRILRLPPTGQATQKPLRSLKTAPDLAKLAWSNLAPRTLFLTEAVRKLIRADWLTRSVMGVHKRIVNRWVVFVLALIVLKGLSANATAQESQATAAAPEKIAPPRANDYVGMTKCSACHFKQYESWKASPHGKTFDYLPTKYRQNAECLECHSGRHVRLEWEQTRSINLNGLSGVSCEDCHGPGREHANLALSYIDQKTELTSETVKVLRSKIQRTALDQCIRCHLSQAHRAHPEFDREAPVNRPDGTLNAPRNRRFLQAH